MSAAQTRAANRTFPRQGEIVTLTITATAQVFDLAATGRFTVDELGEHYFHFLTTTSDVYANIHESSGQTTVTADAGFTLQTEQPEEFLLTNPRARKAGRYLYAISASGSTKLKISIVSSVGD